MAVIVALAVCSTGFAQGSATKEVASGALKLARHHYKKENFEKAASLFLESFEIDPDPVSLFYAGRSQQRAFKWDQAEKNLNRFLELAEARKNKSAMLETAMGKARTHLAEIRQYKAHEAAASWQAPTAWGLAGLGVAAAAYGGWQLSDIATRSADLDRQAKEEKVGDKLAGLDKQTYKDHRAELELDQTKAIVVIGVGAVAVGAGAYLLWARSATRSVIVTPLVGGRGVLVAMRF
jgi:tetratricopeptide (TPR) repeat protein